MNIIYFHQSFTFEELLNDMIIHTISFIIHYQFIIALNYDLTQVEHIA